MGSKVEAMRRIAAETDRLGGAAFPIFMLENMRSWEREGLISVSGGRDRGFVARITEAGRKLAKKGNFVHERG